MICIQSISELIFFFFVIFIIVLEHWRRSHSFVIKEREGKNVDQHGPSVDLVFQRRIHLEERREAQTGAAINPTQANEIFMTFSDGSNGKSCFHSRQYALEKHRRGISPEHKLCEM